MNRLQVLLCAPVFFLFAPVIFDADAAEVFLTPEGPWGQLEYFQTTLEPPKYPSESGRSFPPTQWHFEGKAKDEVLALIRSWQFDEAWVEGLANRAVWTFTNSGVAVTPSDEAILGLSQAQRQQLYTHIWDASYEGTYYGIEPSDLVQLTAQGMPEGLADLVKSLCISIGRRQVLGDIPLILRSLPDDQTRRKFLRAICSTQSLIVRLKIDSQSDLEQLADYWSVGRKHRDILPFLEGVIQNPQTDAIDIVHLLPRAPRKLLNTFPRYEVQIHADLPDCYWTAFGFFSIEPPRRLLDNKNPYDFLEGSQFEAIEGPSQFGDVIVYVKEADNEFVHSCVYVAADIVFTKNGKSVNFPWVLMREETMLLHYADNNLIRKTFRNTRLGSQINGELAEQFVRAPRVPEEQPASPVTTTRGPWGELEYHPVYLEVPPSSMDLIDRPSQSAEWHFHGWTHDQIHDLLKKVGIPPEFFPSLQKINWRFIGDHTVVNPSFEAIIAIQPEARKYLYSILAEWPENFYQRHPFVFENGLINDHFAGAGIRPEIINGVRDLSYSEGGNLLFSDIGFIIGMVQNGNEEESFLKAIHRKRSLMLRLKLDASSDLDSITQYWTAGLKQKDVLPLLEAIKSTESVQRLDVAHLLPPIARKSLYSFPALQDGQDGRFPDSYWSAINFFNTVPVSQYRDSPSVDAYVRSRFRSVQQPFEFGDLLFVVRPSDNRAIHACVHIADDIVYTKNGADLMRPWVFMNLDEMLAHHRYGERRPLVSAWRLRD